MLSPKPVERRTRSTPPLPARARPPWPGSCFSALLDGQLPRLLGSAGVRTLPNGGAAVVRGRRKQGQGRMQAQQLWQAVLGDLQVRLSKSAFDNWLRQTRIVDFADDTVTVGA